MQNWIWHYMQTVPVEDNLHEMSNHCFLGKIRKNASKCCLLKFLLSVWRVFFSQNGLMKVLLLKEHSG